MQCPSAKVNVYTAGGLGVAFFATGPGWVLKMYVITTLEFTPYFNFHIQYILGLLFFLICWLEIVSVDHNVWVQSNKKKYGIFPYLQ